MTHSIAITGSEGTLGQVLQNELPSSFYLTCIDQSEDVQSRNSGHRIDVAGEPGALRNVLSDQDAVVHLAWNLDENYNTDNARYENRLMFENVYRISRKTGVNRVIVASSIHALDMGATFAEEPYRSIARGQKKESVLSEDEHIGFSGPPPSSLYGWGKLLMEHRGQHYAGPNLNIICIRFGGVHPEDEPDYPGAHEPVNYYPSVYCSHNDCGRLVRHAVTLDEDELDGTFHRVYGISDNTRRVHTRKNSLGWMPEDDGEEILDEYWDPLAGDG